MPLTEMGIRHAGPGDHLDGDRLYLQVSKTGSRSWVFKYTLNGRSREMGLGSTAVRSTKDIRAEAARLRALLAQKIDPLDERHRVRQEQRLAAAARNSERKTFSLAAEEYIEANKAGWKNAKHTWQWSNSLEKFAYPVLKRMPVGQISTDDVLSVLKPIWSSKTETASRVRQRMEAILDFAKVNGWRTGDNPARWHGNLEHILPAPSQVAKVEHHPALPYAQAGEFVLSLRARDGIGAKALEFLVLTACRTGEILYAEWAEFDIKERVWRIPGGRTKTKKPHRVALSDAAVELLESLPRIAGCEYVFPSKGNRPLSSMALLALTRRINDDREKAGQEIWVDGVTGERIVPHGFRSSFRDWASDVSPYPGEMAELALGHAVESKVEAAYRRGDMFAKRVHMMNSWASWCGTLFAGARAPKAELRSLKTPYDS